MRNSLAAAVAFLSCLHATRFPSTVTSSRLLFLTKEFVVTIPALVALASCAVAALVVFVVGRAAARLRRASDVSRISVSRQWLIQHQSND
jgi:hypothetical protein